MPALTNTSFGHVLYNLLANLFGLTNAELTLQETGGTLTATANEQILYIENAPLGCFEPRVLFVDLDNMIAGDTTVIRIYYRLYAGGTLKVQDYQTYTGLDGGLTGEKLVAIPLYPDRFGIQITLQQTATGNGYRDYDWEVFTEGY